MGVAADCRVKVECLVLSEGGIKGRALGGGEDWSGFSQKGNRPSRSGER